MTSAHDVADELRRRIPALGAVKLHKLLYYTAGWHLVWAGEELFDEVIEAWVNGPVVATLWADEKYGRQRRPAQPLTDRQVAVVDYVVSRYGHLTARELIEMTHQEDPWREVSRAEPPIESGGSAKISSESMQAWFGVDGQFVELEAEARRLRNRLGDDPFVAPWHSHDLQEAVGRAISGQRVRHQRPT